MIRWASGNRLLLYPDERPDFQLPARYSPSVELQTELDTIKTARDHLRRTVEQNSARPTRLAPIPVDSSLRLGSAFGQSDVTLEDIELASARAGQSQEGLLDEAAERLEPDENPDLVDWYGPSESGLLEDSFTLRLNLATRVLKSLLCTA